MNLGIKSQADYSAMMLSTEPGSSHLTITLSMKVPLQSIFLTFFLLKILYFFYIK